MCDPCDAGIVYTEHSDLRAAPLLSLWSYESAARGPSRYAVERNHDGNATYWLERTDPLLNTILPGTAVSVVLNFGDCWATGPSLSRTTLLPQCAVIGPVTHARVLMVGSRVDAIGAVVPSAWVRDLFDVPASALIDEIVPLSEIWGHEDADRLVESLSPLSLRRRLATLSRALIARTVQSDIKAGVGHAASRLMAERRGQISIERVADRFGVTRQRLAREVFAATGLRPKLFARIARFQTAVPALLSADVSEWALVAPTLGFYDQAHMINEFREFAGSPPTAFFQPHDGGPSVHAAHLRGRPHEWRHGRDVLSPVG